MQQFDSIIPIIVGILLGVILGHVLHTNHYHKLSWKYYNLGVVAYKNDTDSINLTLGYLSKAHIYNHTNKKLTKSIDNMLDVITKQHSIKMEKLKHGDLCENTKKP